jgi:hypothetical protein
MDILLKTKIIILYVYRIKAPSVEKLISERGEKND